MEIFVNMGPMGVKISKHYSYIFDFFSATLSECSL